MRRLLVACTCSGAALAMILGCSGMVDGGPYPAGGVSPGANSGNGNGNGNGSPGEGERRVRPAGEPAVCTAKELPPAPPVRRLTRREYNNTVRDLLGDGSAPARDFGLDGTLGWFENNAGAPVNTLSATQYSEAAESLARLAVSSRLTALAPCAPAGDDDCARSFIQSFGKRAFRRPLTDVEQARYLQLYSVARGGPQGTFANGVRLVIQGLLQSPHFLNHIERGGAAVAGAQAQVLTPYELAARLSYFLWQSIPDPVLFAAADTNKLSTTAEIEAQVTRMLSDQKARLGIGSFFQQWLELDKVDKAEKSETLFPMWSATLRSQLRQETEAFVAHVFWEGDGRLETLLTAPFSFLNGNLARLYEAPGVTGDDFVKTPLNPEQRAGLLTNAGILAAHAHLEGTSPVHRGLFVRNRLLCQVTPPPPDDVDARAPKPDPNHTTRERLAHHASEPYCRGCHRLMDPIGLGFESYDAIGRYRTTENGRPVDASGEILSAGDAEGPFNGAVELAGKLARSSDVRECLAGQFLSFATGAATDDRPCAVKRLAGELTRAGTDLKKLIVALTSSDAFRQRPTVTAEACQ